MNIIQPSAQQHPQTTLGTNVGTMICYTASEAAFGHKTQVGIRTTQTGESVEGDTIHRNKHRTGEQQFGEEFNVMSGMGHD
jgi:hypothetical protein